MLPFASLTERIDWLVRLAVACGLMALLFLFNVSAITVPVLGSVKALLFLIAIYYWSIYRPTLVPLWLLFLAGCLMDLLGGTLIGFNAFVFILAQWLVVGQRRFLMGQPFIMLWVGFAALCCLSLLIQWAFIGALQTRWVPLSGLALSGAFSVAVFPIVYVTLHFAHKLLPAPKPSARFGTQG